MNHPNNLGIYNINTICNNDIAIMSYLNAPYNSAFVRDEQGNFVEEDLFIDE